MEYDGRVTSHCCTRAVVPADKAWPHGGLEASGMGTGEVDSPAARIRLYPSLSPVGYSSLFRQSLLLVTKPNTRQMAMKAVTADANCQTLKHQGISLLNVNK